MRNHQAQQQQEDQELMVANNFQKNPNHETTQNHHGLPSPSSRSSSQDLLSCSSPVAGEEYMPPLPQNFKKFHHGHNIHVSKKTNIGNEGFTINNPNYEVIKKPNSVCCSSRAAREGATTTPQPAVDAVEESGRDRLKRHRVEMSGRVWIPDIWGHEDLLKDWIDCTVFDSSLGNNSIMSARAALMQEGRSTVRIENKC